MGSLTVGCNAMDYRLPGREMERAVGVCKHFKCIPKVGPTIIILPLSNLLLTPHHVMVVVSSHNHTQKSGFFPVSSLIPPFCSWSQQLTVLPSVFREDKSCNFAPGFSVGEDCGNVPRQSLLLCAEHLRFGGPSRFMFPDLSLAPLLRTFSKGPQSRSVWNEINHDSRSFMSAEWKDGFTGRSVDI